MACNGTYSIDTYLCRQLHEMNTYKAVESVTLELEKCYTKIVEWYSGAPLRKLWQTMYAKLAKLCFWFVISVINQFRVKTNA